MGKRVCLVVGLVVGLLVPVPAAGVAGFGDVEPGRYYTEPVQWMVDGDIIDTANSACFAPDVGATRDETALYMWRMREQPEAPPHPFLDVIGEDQNKAVSWMYANKITTGKSATTFAPNDTLTRAEVAAFLHRLAGKPHATTHPFTDVTAPWQQQPVAWLSSSGITTGTSPTTFAPDEPVTRGQLATFLYRFKGKPPVTVNPASPDCNEFTAVSAGEQHTCALRTDKTIACWGSNNYGESNPPVGGFTAISAKGNHSCALRTDQTISCWGSNNSGESSPPPGQFTAVSAGERHACGIRNDKTITCWGSNNSSQSNPPPSQFNSVAAGSIHTCGLRTDHTVTCWSTHQQWQDNTPLGQFVTIAAGGFDACGLRTDHTVKCWGVHPDVAPSGHITAIDAGNYGYCGLRTDKTVSCWGPNDFGEPSPPTGQFSAITAGSRHACGIRINNTITCWGHNYNDLTDTPSGRFSAVAISDGHSCGLRIDNTIACWGDSASGRTYAPRGQFTAITPGWYHTCGLRTDNTVTCWGWIGGQTRAPSGQFKTVTSGTWHSCALRTNSTVACWGSNHNGESDPPDGQFTSVFAGPTYSCGLRKDQTVACWGGNYSDEYFGLFDAPAGSFKSINTGDFPCGIRTDDTISCWGPGSNRADNSTVPSGRFSAVSSSRSPQYGGSHACGRRDDKVITCWGSNQYGESKAPVGQFTAVATGDALSCGLRTNKTITCWGYRGGSGKYSGQPYEPKGKFSSVTAGYHHSCGIRTDSTITCWGFAPAVALPIGVQFGTGPDWPDPDMCRPFARGHLSPGFPQRGIAGTTGKVRVAVLFVDFPDAEAEYSTRRESRTSLPYAEQYLEAASYETLDVEFVPLHRWLRVEKNFGDYLGSVFNESESISDAVARLADPEFDFSEVDAVMLVGPSTHFRDANAGGEVSTDEGSLPTSRINVPSSFIVFRGDGTLRDWGHAAAHELAHNLGLADYYDSGGSRAARTLEVADWRSTEFGLMGFDVLLPPDHRAGWGRYREMLAWSRWLLGWLKPTQIRCVTDTETETTVSLSPVAEPGNGTAMAAIPLSGTEVIVMESRRRLGYDSGLPLNTEGLLVYTVDAGISTGMLPIKGANETATGFSAQSPLLTEGQSITVAGYTITLLSDDGETHTVKISKASVDMAEEPDDGDDMAEEVSMTPGDGTSITMGRADWSTGYFQAQVYKQLLEELGYSVSEPSELELGPSLAYLGMSQGDFDFWVNSWYPGHVSWWAPELPDGSNVGDHLTIVGNEMVAGGLQGFLITKSFADEHGVTHLDQLNDDADILAAFDANDQSPGNGVADIYGCTESWTCDNIIDSQIAFSEWTNIAQIKAGYDAMFAEATVKANAGEPMVIYTWTPSAYITQLRPGDNVLWLATEDVLDDSNPTGLEGGEGHDQRPGQANIGPDSCPAAANADNCQLGWVAADIQVTANTEWLNANPYAAALFCAVTLSVIDVSLANVDQSNAGDDATEDFIAGLAADWIADNRGAVDGWLESARMPPMEPTCPDTVIPPALQWR